MTGTKEPAVPASVTTAFGLFAEAAARVPDASVYVDRSGKAVSYQQLFRIATQLAERIKEPHHDCPS
ncbi:hypothetical protein [Streptomyces sp. NPDC088256]|uniref:hypothetical protein n=1 Tax=Streptomyces sp. NPDC088256 TaxID=3365848 RepID=UPI0037F2398D